MKELLFATTNAGKLAELRALVTGLRVRVLSLAELGETRAMAEDAGSFRGNAEKKATAMRDRHRMAVLADDSGLCVDALGGAPGVQSARYTGGGDEANIAKLLEQMKDHPDERRTAAFVCALCFAAPGRWPATVEARCPGRIARAPRGHGGFGYDPVFEFPELGRTFAELSGAEKNRVSHRARAMALILPSIREWAELATPDGAR